jgi:hypothetical protein
MPVQAEYDIKFSNAGDLGENLRALKKRGR